MFYFLPVRCAHLALVTALGCCLGVATAQADELELALEPGLASHWSFGDDAGGSPGLGEHDPALTAGLSASWLGSRGYGALARFVYAGDLADREGDDLYLADVAYAASFAALAPRRMSHLSFSAGLSFGYLSARDQGSAETGDPLVAGPVFGVAATSGHGRVLLGLVADYRMLFQPGTSSFSAHHVIALRMRVGFRLRTGDDEPPPSP